jgi:hypothetical protein
MLSNIKDIRNCGYSKRKSINNRKLLFATDIKGNSSFNINCVENYLFDYTCVISTHQIPSCNGNFDLANRMIIIPFEAEFVNNPVKKNQRKKHLQCIVDLIFTNDAAKTHLSTWLINGAKKNIEEPLKPKCVIDAWCDYLKKENLLFDDV